VRGQVKWFNNTNGYGFMGRDDGPDVFVHYSAIVGEGYKTLNEGDAGEFEIVQGAKGPQAPSDAVRSSDRAQHCRHSNDVQFVFEDWIHARPLDIRSSDWIPHFGSPRGVAPTR
jgi:CspA family cold shock protein